MERTRLHGIFERRLSVVALHPVNCSFIHINASKHTVMLPSITTGQFGIASRPIYGSNGVHGIRIVNNAEAQDEERNCPSLPLISEGSFTSLVSRRSEKSLERGKESGKRINEVSEFCNKYKGISKLIAIDAFLCTRDVRTLLIFLVVLFIEGMLCLFWEINPQQENC